MSDDELEKLAAEMQNIKPSEASRQSGLNAAMAAFDAEFESEAVAEDISETAKENLTSPQGTASEQRLTGQTIGTGPVATFGRDAMSKLKDIFSFSPKAAMMMGSCAAALFATSLYFPNTTFEGMPPKSAPQAIAADVDAGEDKMADVKIAEKRDVTAPTVSAPTARVVAPSAEPIAPARQETTSTPAEAPKVADAKTLTSDDTTIAKTVEAIIPEAPMDVEDLVTSSGSMEMAEATPSNVVTIERRILKTPARTVERAIPSVTKTETRRVVKKAGIPTGRTLPAKMKEVSRRVVKTPAATQERTIPAITTDVTARVKQEDGSFKTVTATVVVQPASSELVMSPPTYETVTETVVVEPERVEYEPGTAEYETVTEAVVVQEASTELVTIPPAYETVRETIMINADGTSEILSSEALAAPVGPRGGITSVSGFLAAEEAATAPTTPARRAEFKVAPSAPITAASSGTAYADASMDDEVIVTSTRRSRSAKTSGPAFVAELPPGNPMPVTATIEADKAPVRMAETGTRIKTAGKFTVFNGVNEQVVQSTETIVSKTGEILCRVIIPAKYRTITKEVLVSPARTVEREIPAETKDIKVKVKTEDGSYKEVVRTFVTKEAWTDIDIIPAVYETRSERILVEPAREEWKPGSEAINAAELLVSKPVVKKPKPKPKPKPQSGLLTAGDYDDVLNPDLYKVYLDKMLQGQLKGKDLPYVDADQRINIRVVDRNGKPVPLADITLTTSKRDKMFPLRTSADGMAYLYPNFDGLESGTRIKVSAKGGRTARTKLTRKLARSGGDLIIELDIEAAPIQKMDLLLTIDATGSMGDEMRYLQSELQAIVERVEQAHLGIDIRTGLVVYRDVGDTYVVREVPFTDDIDAFREALSEQKARGGGDTPEAMHTALQTGLQMDWRDDALKVNLLVADAPPHNRHLTETWDAGLLSRTRGIHMVPLAASGVDKTAEFLMRSMAQITGGRFLFLTDDSGIGNPHAKPTVDCYVVTRLDGLVTRVLSSLIKGERMEPEAGEVIRSVGNYRSGTCKIDPQNPALQNVSYKNE